MLAHKLPVPSALAQQISPPRIISAGTKEHPVAYRPILFGEWFDDETTVNWTLRYFQKPGDEQVHPKEAARIARIMCELNLAHGTRKELLAPSPVQFNAVICAQRDLFRRIPLGSGVTLLRNPDAPADGTLLNRSEVLGLSVGGCAIGTFSYRGRMVATHMGRDCLFDRVRIETGKASRKNESVVFSAIDALGAWNHPEDLRVFVHFPIGPRVLTHPLDHPQYGEFNRRMYEDISTRWGEWCVPSLDARAVSVDLGNLVRAQCVSLGVPKENIVVDEIAVESMPGAYHTRHHDALRRDMRNLAIIARII